MNFPPDTFSHTLELNTFNMPKMIRETFSSYFSRHPWDAVPFPDRSEKLKAINCAAAYRKFHLVASSKFDELSLLLPYL